MEYSIIFKVKIDETNRLVDLRQHLPANGITELSLDNLSNMNADNQWVVNEFSINKSHTYATDVNITVDWGEYEEATIGTYNLKDSAVAINHTYSHPGIYYIKITANGPDLLWEGSVNTTAGTLNDITVGVSISGSSPFKAVWRPFNTFTKIEKIPEKIFANCVEQRSYKNAFNRCFKLKTVPSALFANSPDATDFCNLFQNCTSLYFVPDTIFKKNTKANNFFYTFNGAGTAISKTIGPKLFSFIDDTVERLCFCMTFAGYSGSNNPTKETMRYGMPVDSNVFLPLTNKKLYSFFKSGNAIATWEPSIFKGNVNVSHIVAPEFERDFADAWSAKKSHKIDYVAYNSWNQSVGYKSNLKTIYISDFTNIQGNEQIDISIAGAFRGNDNLTNVKLPDISIDQIKSVSFDDTFRGCKKLNRIENLNCKHINKFSDFLVSTGGGYPGSCGLEECVLDKETVTTVMNTMGTYTDANTGVVHLGVAKATYDALGVADGIPGTYTEETLLWYAGNKPNRTAKTMTDTTKNIKYCFFDNETWYANETATTDAMMTTDFVKETEVNGPTNPPVED